MQLPTRYKYIIGAVLLLPIILYFLKYKDVLQIQNDASTKSGTTVPGKTVNVFNNNNLALNSCNEKLAKCANKLRIVVINTDSTHAEVRRLIGSLHHYHRGDVKAVIYGIDLSPARVNEVLLWEHVEYIDLEQEFISAVRIDGKPKQHQKVQAWKPLVIKHSVDVFGKILYVDSDFIFQSSILGSPLLQQFEANGYYFAGEKCHENMQMQVYSYNSAAYNDILVPLVECSRRQCSKEELKLSEDPSKQYPCQNIPELVFRKQGIQPNEDKREVCTLIMREDFITSVSQLPGTGSKSWQVSNDQRLKDNNGKIHIAIGFPSTTNGNANPNLDTIPVFRVLVSSFLQSIEKNANGKYIYSLYLAFDESDAYYNKPENQKQIMDRFNDLAKGYPVQLILLQCVDSNAWVPFLWNVAFQHAMDDGADYFYQLNDDVRIETPNWSDVFVNALRANPFKSDFGATGPLDIGNQGILTQAFVSRTHYNIFGFLYPYVFKNWFSDDWVTKIYEHLNSNLRGTHETMKVHNSQSFGTRYFVCDVTGRADLAVELDKGKKRIEMWLKENK